jgi:hypothetical protein
MHAKSHMNIANIFIQRLHMKKIALREKERENKSKMQKITIPTISNWKMTKQFKYCVRIPIFNMS